VAKIFRIILLIFASCVMLAARGQKRTTQIYTPGKLTDFYLFEKGEASWYGPGFHGKTTAGGKRFNTFHYMIAHKTLPIGEVVCLRNPANNRVIVGEVADRGPYISGRIVDLSYVAMRKLGLISRGHGLVEVYRTSDALAQR
jgi:rare lipoprotein A